MCSTRRSRRDRRPWFHPAVRDLAAGMRHGERRASKPRLARLVGSAVHPDPRRHRNQANVAAVSTVSVIRTVALEEAFLHPRVWDLFPAALQQKYQPVRARLSDVGPERIRQMDAAGIDVQVLSHVQPGVQVLADDQAELSVSVCREVNDWLAEVVAARTIPVRGLCHAAYPVACSRRRRAGASGSPTRLQRRVDQRTHQRALPR